MGREDARDRRGGTFILIGLYTSVAYNGAGPDFSRGFNLGWDLCGAMKAKLRYCEKVTAPVQMWRELHIGVSLLTIGLAMSASPGDAMPGLCCSVSRLH